MRNNIMQNKTPNSTSHSALPSQTPQTSETSRRGFLNAAGLTGAGVLLLGTRARAQSSNTAGRFVTVEGNRIWIEERGRGIPIVMSAGGQNRVETLRPLSEKLSAKYRVITWDRANMGRSDLVLKGARDIDIWTDQQAGIMTQLNARPAYLIGASSGGRTSYIMALRYPDYCRGLLTYLTTGGGTIGESLAKQYYFDYADLAEKSGMAAVAQRPFWAERIKLNPANEEKLLSMDPKEFARVMRRYGTGMRSNDPMIGITADELRQIKANGTPVAITQGCPEAPQHRRDRSELYAQLTGGTLIPTPEHYCAEATTGATFDKQILHPEVPESGPFRAYEMLSDIPGVIDNFITQTEARYKMLGLGPDATSFTPKKVGNAGPAY
jgi:pimeloyl-ACP methyl ester carboxylesterase